MRYTQRANVCGLGRALSYPAIGDPNAIPENWRTGRDFNGFVLRAAVCD